MAGADAPRTRVAGQPTTLTVRVLGELAVDGVPPASFGSRKARTLLTALALGRGRRVGVDTLVETVWGSRPPAQPADQLSVLVSRIRTVVGRERVEHRDGGYRLHYDWLDLDALEELVSEADARLSTGAFTAAATAARAAMALARGPVAGELAGEWAIGELAAVGRLTARARRLAAEALLGVGDWSGASELAARALDDDPYAEDALRVLMRAEVTGGRIGAALSAYAGLRERLDGELGTSPSPATESLHTAILRGEVPAPVGQTDTSPGPPIVGRRTSLAELDAVADAPRDGVPVIWVVGEPGIGKTTLVQAWAAARQTAGDPVVVARCTPLERSFPLGALTAALGRHLRALDREQLAGVLGPDHDQVAPLLGFAPAPAQHSLLADSVAGPALLYEALAGVVERAAGPRRLLLVVDDVQEADRAMLEWLAFVARRPLPLAVVGTVRVGQADGLPDGHLVELGPLLLDDARLLVGDDRAEELYHLSGGNPLFLVELARTRDGTLPATLVDSISARCTGLGERAATTVRAAAVIGTVVDLDLLAAVLARRPIEVLDDLELAAQRRLLVEAEGTFRFQHDLVRVALAEEASHARSTLLHREVARVLSQRVGDPSVIAHHAHLGGDRDLEASALRAAAVRAAELFDHATAESLLDQAAAVSADPGLRAERALVRIRRGDYPAALDDVESALAGGSDATDTGAWAAYYLREFGLARRYADQGLHAPRGSRVRARSLVIGGRISHATGDIDAAESLLTRAVGEIEPAEHAVATAWLGTLRSHQSRTGEALQLLAPATRLSTNAEHTFAVMHAMMFRGHALAVAGRAAEAIGAFTAYEAEAVRRDVDRFRGRGMNMTGWVLHSLGAIDEAADLHVEGAALGDRRDFPEMQVAAAEDLAEIALWRDEPAGAWPLLDRVAETLDSSADRLVFGWRLRMKLWWLRGRVELDAGSPEQALQWARILYDDAAGRGIPRYAAVAEILGLRARLRLGEAPDLAGVEPALGRVDAGIPLESWWLTGQLGADLGLPGIVDRAAVRARTLAAAAGDRGDAFGAWAATHLDRWSEQAAVRRR